MSQTEFEVAHEQVLSFISASANGVDELNDILDNFKTLHTQLRQNKACAIQHKTSIVAFPKWPNWNSPSAGQDHKSKQMLTLSTLLNNSSD